MHLKDHLVDGQLHIIFNFQGGKQQIVAVVGQIIRGAPEFLFDVDNLICHIADVHGLIFVPLKIEAVKIHRLSFVGEDHIDNKIPQLLARIIVHAFAEMLYIHRVYISADIVHRTILFFQGLLHNI